MVGEHVTSETSLYPIRIVTSIKWTRPIDDAESHNVLSSLKPMIAAEAFQSRDICFVAVSVRVT